MRSTLKKEFGSVHSAIEKLAGSARVPQAKNFIPK
jgi:hypothetical protein